MAYQNAIKAFYDAGCRYLQFDDYRLGLSLLAGGNEEGEGPRPRRRSSAGDLHRLHQQGAEGQARRHDHHHACLPRQFPLDLDLVRRLRAGGGEPARPSATTTAISSNTTPIAPAASSRCVSCRRATRSSCSAWSPRSRAGWSRATTSRGASTRRRNSSRSISCACRRNAASPRPRKATCWPRTSNGPSCAMIVEMAEEVWGK